LLCGRNRAFSACLSPGPSCPPLPRFFSFPGKNISASTRSFFTVPELARRVGLSFPRLPFLKIPTPLHTRSGYSLQLQEFLLGPGLPQFSGSNDENGEKCLFTHSLPPRSSFPSSLCFFESSLSFDVSDHHAFLPPPAFATSRAPCFRFACASEAFNDFVFSLLVVTEAFFPSPSPFSGYPSAPPVDFDRVVCDCF